MRLTTLGGLYLENGSFGRVKPLLLLAFLALEGPKERRYLAELFWPGASDPMNSLSVALTRLRKGLSGAIHADEVRAWTDIETDTAAFLEALETGAFARACDLYTGPFLHGVYLPDWSAELEEWVYATRETLAGRMQRGLLRLAELEAAQGHFRAAAGHAERLYTLESAPELEPESLTRLYPLLQAGDSPLGVRLREEAALFDIELDVSPSEARSRLQRALLGREEERARLRDVPGGAWAWVRGGAGLGKTALLRSTEGTFLPGRSGLPFATLEPVLGDALGGGESSIVQRLRNLPGPLLIDNWELVDSESRRVLARLRELGTQAPVVISSRERPPFKVDTVIDLAPLSAETLKRYPGAWERTQGLPVFVEAFLRGETLSNVLEDKLSPLSAIAREVYFALSLLDKASPAVVRRALALDASEMAQALEGLLSRGFIEPSGQVRVREAAQEYLEAHPTELGPLCLKLARCLSNLEAFPLFKRSRHLWTPEDEPKAVEAYLAWANELLKRGFPQRAFEALEDAPESKAVTFLRARALERAGRYTEAFGCTEGLVDIPEVMALKSTLLWRLGKPEEAERAAKSALDGDMPARAEAQNTLGHLDRSAGAYESALGHFRRAAALWFALGERTRWAAALNNVAMVRSELGDKADEAYAEALEAAGNNLVERATVFINMGLLYERREKLPEAEKMYRQTVEVAEEAGAIVIAGKAWNNLGHVFEIQNRFDESREAYNHALRVSQHAGDRYLTGLALINLAELDGDADAWEEALHIFEEAGHHAMAERCRAETPLDHPVRRRSEQQV